MGLLSWLLLGIIVGALAQWVVPIRRAGGCTGCVVTIAIGLGGAAIGGFIGTQLGWGSVDRFDIRSILLAFLGAVILLLLLRAISGRRA
jgi:uncharacterized membrane protein YeaQ/YmgE (transglycosylase-associated protein family)